MRRPVNGAGCTMWAPSRFLLLVVVCGARHGASGTVGPPAPPLDRRAVLEAAETGTVSLNSLLRAIAHSPRLAADTRLAPPPLERPATQFGPFGQLLALGEQPSDQVVLERSEPLTPTGAIRATRWHAWKRSPRPTSS